MKTWHYELIVVSVVLIATTFFFSNNLVNWITTLAIIMTFQHAQIGDRLQERQKILDKPSVECYWKLNWFFGIKEILWITAFILMQNYAAIIGSFMFSLYPIWRKYYRTKIKPVNADSISDGTCEHPYMFIHRTGDYEKCDKCGKVLCEG